MNCVVDQYLILLSEMRSSAADSVCTRLSSSWGLCPTPDRALPLDTLETLVPRLTVPSAPYLQTPKQTQLNIQRALKNWPLEASTSAQSEQPHINENGF